MISRDRCQEIVKQCNKFYCKEVIIRGVKIEMYNYRMASYDDFVKYDAFELRGLSFVEYECGWVRFIALHKFFNINEIPGCSFEDLKNIGISRVQEKMDGSLISFVVLPGNIIIAKSKMSFESDQAKMANKILESCPKTYSFVLDMLLSEKMPIFELTSSFNQIVVSYDETRLTLLQIRTDDGKYLGDSDMIKYSVEYDLHIPEVIKHCTLEGVLFMKKTRTDDIEGWVVTFENGEMFKVKTDSYISKHGHISDIRENNIISAIIDGNIDDILSCLRLNSEKRGLVDKITETMFNRYMEDFREIMTIIEEYLTGSNNRKKIVNDLKRIGTPWFFFIVKLIGEDMDGIECKVHFNLKVLIKKKTNGLENAKKYIDGVRLYDLN